MMRTSVAVAIALGSLLVLGGLALAQPRPARPPNPPPSGRSGAAGTPAKPRASADNPYDNASAASPAASSGSPSGAPANDAGRTSASVPPPADEASDRGARLSPLNPAANEISDAGLQAASVDYDRLLADLASLRARTAAVSDTLFRSRLAISLETSGDHGRIASLNVALDDGAIWTSPAAFRAEDATTVYNHAVAPGHHAVTVDLERRDDRDDTFRSSQRSRFIVDVPADGRLLLEIKLWDDSSMGEFPSDKKGHYDLRVRAIAKALALPQPRGQ
jgi:hypothetical protein